MVDRYRINLNYKYENMSTRYDIPENSSFTATYSNDQTKYTIFDTKGSLSMRKLYDERGNVYFGVDEEIRERLQAKLMRAILTFRAE